VDAAVEAFGTLEMPYWRARAEALGAGSG
jgi:hypothetical protein